MAGGSIALPLCIDLYCGLGGWAEGFLSEGYDVVGFDIERHVYPVFHSVSDETGTKLPGNNSAIRWADRPIARLKDAKGVEVRGEWQQYPGQLVLQDALTLHGSQFKDAAVIVASPPCQKYSYMAMPWSKAKEMREHYWNDSGAVKQLNALFSSCFRIQREASIAAGRKIPMVVENVKGAQPWVGSARWHFGSFYLWGDVPALMPFAAGRKSQHKPLCDKPSGTGATSWFFGDSKGEGRYYGVEGLKGPGGDWFKDGRQGQDACVLALASGERDGVKQENGSGTKQPGNDWFGSGADCSLQRKASSRSSARKAASAQIAKIPFELARHIAAVYKP